MSQVRRRRRNAGVLGHNAWTFSEQLENAAWTRLANTNVAVDFAVAADGSSTMDKLYSANSTLSDHGVSRAFPIGVTPSQLQAVSFYGLQSELSWVWIRTTNKAGVVSTSWFNLNPATLGTISPNHTAAITSASNGNTRCSVVFDAGAGAGGGLVEIGYTNANGSTSYTPPGGDGCLFWGFQFELNSSVVGKYRSTGAVAFP